MVPEGGDASEALSSQESGDAGDTLSVDTAELEPGGYDVVLVDEAGDEVARNTFWVRARDAEVQVSTDRSTYGVGDPVQVEWEDGPANRWDWIGLFRAGADDTENDDYLLWGYTGGHDSGALPPSVRRGDDPGRLLPGASVAAAAGRLRRALPDHRPVRVGRECRVHRRTVTARG